MNDAPRQAFIGMGANLGDRFKTLVAAMRRLSSWPGIGYIGSSSIYETDPLGDVEQPKFLNAVVGIQTRLEPEVLLEVALEIEREFGRIRDVRWGPRTLDLDLLAFEEESRASPHLKLPHPRMLERAFVVVPLREVLELPPFRTRAWEDLRGQLARPISLNGVFRFSSAVEMTQGASFRMEKRDANDVLEGN